jgi:hypothetical protein
MLKAVREKFHPRAYHGSSPFSLHVPVSRPDQTAVAWLTRSVGINPGMLQLTDRGDSGCFRLSEATCSSFLLMMLDMSYYYRNTTRVLF